MNKFLSAALLAALSGIEIQAQSLKPAPILVVNITIDQLRTDYIEQFVPFYSANGFKKILGEGTIYENVSYPFSPVNRASAIATIATGTTPNYNNIIGTKWLDRNTLRPITCTDDDKYGTSPQRIATSTISDELKVSSNGGAIVYGIAAEKDAAVISAGHAADGAFWISEDNNWTTSEYYPKSSQRWIKSYNDVTKKPTSNDDVVNLALECVKDHAMGRDAITDMLFITLSAKCDDMTKWQNGIEDTYRQLDRNIESIIGNIENNVGKGKVMFVITSTGYTEEQSIDYQRYRIPTGTFYINRTADLLNMYLGAIYGQGKYVETCFLNQIYLNRSLIEQRRLNLSEIITRAKDFLIQNSGVSGTQTSPYNPSISGDIFIEVSPGWQLYNENTQEKYLSRAAYVPFPIIIYGIGTSQRIYTPVTVDRISPTIAKTIHIRAPNACSSAPLQ